MQVSRYSPHKIATVFLALFLSSCLERTSAPAPVVRLGTQIDSPAGAVMVREGDTVWRISQNYRLPLRDIIALNALEPPYALAVGQRIRLPEPLEHKVGGDDTLYRLSRMYQVPVSKLVKTNKIAAPYRLKVGQVVRIPRKIDAPVVREARVERASVLASVARQPLVDAPPKKNTFIEPSLMPMLAASKRPDFVWPLRGKVLSGYGAKDGGLYNDGINIAAPRGTPVAAAADGVVAYVGDDISSYGNLVLIRHSGGMVTAYAHLSGVNVAKGASVRRGQAIGTVGSTGTVANAQLHFEVRKGTETLDPRKYLG